MASTLDLAIIGGGPAALTAALYAGRFGLAPVVFEQGAVGGVLTQIAKIENYPGFVGAGAELAVNMRHQAEQVGARFEYGTCTDIQSQGAGFVLTIDGESQPAHAVIIATGSASRPLNFELNVPVSYCALCDGVLARGKRVAVIGGANSAVQEALELVELVGSLTLITHSTLKADQYLVDQLKQYPQVEIRENLEPTAELLNTFDYVFVFIGKNPATSMLKSLAATMPGKLLDEKGYIIAPGGRAALAGLFAAGDVRAGALHQAVGAAADGASAALAAHQYLQAHTQK